MRATAAHARAYAIVAGATASFISPDGHTEPIDAADDEDIRQAVIRRAMDEVRRSGSPVELVTSGDRGAHHMLIGTEGEITTIANRPDPVPNDGNGRREYMRRDASGNLTNRTPTSDANAVSSRPAAAASARPSFIDPPDGAPAAETGWRGALSRLGFTIGPSVAESRRSELRAIVSRRWVGCRTIAIVNGKGGVGKTMTAANLAAVYGRLGGGNVLVWDNNDTRGTLGWRTEQGTYDTTLRDLLPVARDLLLPSASVSTISRFVHHQAADRYDVLRSNPELLAAAQRIGGPDFDLVMQVVARYYRLVIFDSGNDESAERWLRMIDSSYQLVIPTLTAPESAESAALLLDALRNRDDHSAALARNAVVVVTQSERSSGMALRRIAADFQPLVRAVHIVPFDPALKSGPLRFDALRTYTQQAWVDVAAAAAQVL